MAHASYAVTFDAADDVDAVLAFCGSLAGARPSDDGVELGDGRLEVWPERDRHEDEGEGEVTVFVSLDRLDKAALASLGALVHWTTQQYAAARWRYID
jgi:hypothetical protein